MNLPNKLTLFRVFLIPVFVVFMLVPFDGVKCEGIYKWIALAIFVIASLTDMADGKIARKYKLVTNFGKFMDPIADKLLVCSAMICLIEIGRIPSWAVIIIIGRELIIDGFRLVASNSGIVIAASIWGKSKTVVQMIMVIMMIVNFPWKWYGILTQIVMFLAVVLTIISLVDYLVKNKSVLSFDNKA